MRDRPGKVRITVDLDEKLYLKVKHKALDERRHMTTIIRQFLIEWVEEDSSEATSQKQTEK